MMAAVKAKGKTTIENAAREPEIVDLAEMLIDMGADIRNVGSHVLEVYGVDELHPCDHTTVGDRIVAGTYTVLGALCADELTVTGFDPAHLDIPLTKMELMGVPITRLERGVVVRKAEHLVPADIQTLPYPGFPTDMQAQMMVLNTMADGASFITENIFENRFMLAAELTRMGAQIRVEDRHALVKGPCRLTGAQVKSPDLRGGAALVIAGLVAEGTTYVSETRHIKRGYEDFVGRLQSIGANIEHIDVPSEDEDAE